MGNLSLLSALSAIMASYLGSGINYMPSAFNNAGWMNSIIMLLLVSFLSSLIVYFLLRSFTRKSSQGMGKDVTYSMLGLSVSKKLMVFMDLSNIMSQVLTMMAYQKYIVQSIVVFIKNFDATFSEQTIQYIVFASLFIPLTLFSTLEKFSKLRFLSYICVFSAIISPVVLLILNFVCSDFIISNNQDIEKSYDYFFSGGIILFAMAGMTSLIEIYKEMIERTKKNEFIICCVSSSFAFIVYGLIGLLGYKIFGNSLGKKEILEIYLDNRSKFNQYIISNNSWVFYLVKIQGLIGILSLFCSFPLQVPSILSSLETIFKDKITKTKSLTRSIIITLIGSITVFNLIPNIPLNVIFELAGYTFFNWSNFLFPSIIYFYRKQNVPKFEKVICVIIITASMILSFIGPYYTFKNQFSQLPSNEVHKEFEVHNNFLNKTF